MKTIIDINSFDKSEIAKYRLKVIQHYQQFGLASTLNAYPISRATLFLWKQKLSSSNGRLRSLIPKSTKPKTTRSMVVHPLVLGEIKRLRQKHYRLGKHKLKPLLESFCKHYGLKPPSSSLIGKIIKRCNLFYQRSTYGYHDPHRKPYQRKTKKIRVLKAPKPKQAGYIQGDTVETITTDGLRRYTISFIDVKLKLSYSKTYTGKLSNYTRD
ncbi:TPA: hypothetical protein ENS27_16295 [bacterium]|nr:hypothetical protein [bacterium]